MKGRAIAAVDVLALALEDADAGTRTEAASSLRQLGRNADEALADLQTALKNTKLERLTRIHCAYALGRIGSAESVPCLKEILAEAKNDPELRRACADSLGQLGQKAADAVAALAAVLTAKESAVGLRRACAEALDRMGSEARPSLTRCGPPSKTKINLSVRCRCTPSARWAAIWPTNARPLWTASSRPWTTMFSKSALQPSKRWAISVQKAWAIKARRPLLA